MLKVYLAGPIRDLTIEDACRWRTDIIESFSFKHRKVFFYNPMRGQEDCVAPGEVIAPKNFRSHLKFYTSEALFNRDIHMLNRSDLVFVHYPKPEIYDPFRSPGTLFEIGYAIAKDKIVIVSCNCEEFLDHPFIQKPCISYRELGDAQEYLSKLVLDEEYTK